MSKITALNFMLAKIKFVPSRRNGLLIVVLKLQTPCIFVKLLVMASFSERLKHFQIVRKILYAIVGAFSWPALVVVNKLTIAGTEHLKKLPKSNVLFVSNHQTYFADVITFLHIFCAVK